MANFWIMDPGMALERLGFRSVLNYFSNSNLTGTALQRICQTLRCSSAQDWVVVNQHRKLHPTLACLPDSWLLQCSGLGGREQASEAPRSTCQTLGCSSAQDWVVANKHRRPHLTLRCLPDSRLLQCSGLEGRQQASEAAPHPEVSARLLVAPVLRTGWSPTSIGGPTLRYLPDSRLLQCSGLGGRQRASEAPQPTLRCLPESWLL